MKYIGEYTTRGQMTDSATKMVRIPLFQGDYSIGYRVKNFVVSVQDRDDTATHILHCMLATEKVEPDGLKDWDWSRPTQIAWNRTTEDANQTSMTSPYYLEIDPENLIVEDLFVGIYIYGGSGTEVCNYMITLEKYELEPFQGLGAMVNNQSQG